MSETTGIVKELPVLRDTGSPAEREGVGSLLTNLGKRRSRACCASLHSNMSCLAAMEIGEKGKEEVGNSQVSQV
jgi:hypothetical protein